MDIPHDDRLTLFGIAYAGGSAAAIYGRWARLLPAAIRVQPLELAGHGRRMNEAFPESIEAAVADLLKTVAPQAARGPYALVGHSMGSTIVYELARALHAAGLPPPRALFLSGRQPPHLAYPQRNLYMLDDETFLSEIRKLGGTPVDFFRMKDLVQAFLPILRNDYRIIEQYRFAAPVHVTPADIVVFRGDGDQLADHAGSMAWAGYTSGRFALHEFAGGHFFVNDHQEAICRIVAAALLPRAGGERPGDAGTAWQGGGGERLVMC